MIEIVNARCPIAEPLLGEEGQRLREFADGRPLRGEASGHSEEDGTVYRSLVVYPLDAAGRLTLAHHNRRHKKAIAVNDSDDDDKSEDDEEEEEEELDYDEDDDDDDDDDKDDDKDDEEEEQQEEDDDDDDDDDEVVEVVWPKRSRGAEYLPNRSSGKLVYSPMLDCYDNDPLRRRDEPSGRVGDGASGSTPGLSKVSSVVAPTTTTTTTTTTMETVPVSVVPRRDRWKRR